MGSYPDVAAARRPQAESCVHYGLGFPSARRLRVIGNRQQEDSLIDKRGVGAIRLRRGFRNGVLLGVLAVVAIVLLTHHDLPRLGAVVMDLPAALAVSAAVHLPQIVLTAMAWYALLAPPVRPSPATMVLLRWFRETAAALLPAGALVGQAAAARLLVRCQVPIDVAAASATVDMAVEATTQLLFSLAGFVLLLAGGGSRVTGVAAASLAVTAASAIGVILVQHRRSLSWMKAGVSRVARRLPAVRVDWLEEFPRSVQRLHAEWRRLTLAMLWHSAAWLLGAVEIIGVLHLIGQPVTWTDAFVIESLSQAFRNVGFMLPGGIGVNEAAIVGAAALVGVPPSPALAAALVRRTREVIFGLAGVIVWQRSEMATLA